MFLANHMLRFPLVADHTVPVHTPVYQMLPRFLEPFFSYFLCCRDLNDV